MRIMRCMLVTVMFFTFHLSPFASMAQTLPLSETATARVLTCGAGNDFYTTFGHSAIRICDTANGIDIVYNYGTFDFDTPHFYWKFARGRLNYRLGRTDFDHFIAEYEYEGRAVWEQQLDFTPQEVNNLFVMLEWNYLPENRYYQYDFFRDNCATRVRDMVEAAAPHRSPFTSQLSTPTSHSYRYWLHEAMAGGCLEWWTIGVDLVLGLPADHRCTASESMFYPIAMMELLSPFTSQLLQETRPPLKRSFPPLVVFCLIFAAAALLTWKKRWPRWADRVLFVVAGLIGLFLLFMWVGTDHYCTAWNLNILWASPLLLLIAIRLERSPRWALWLQEACFAGAAVWVLVCGLTPALLPIIIMLALRVGCLLGGADNRASLSRSRD